MLREANTDLNIVLDDHVDDESHIHSYMNMHIEDPASIGLEMAEPHHHSSLIISL